MPIFCSDTDKDAHQKFVDWIDANPKGFVINRKGAQEMVLHIGSCGHFKPYDWANQTSNLKACSDDRAATLYVRRCTELSRETPADGWHGITVLDRKQ